MRAHSLHADEAKRISEKNLRTPERLSLRVIAGPAMQRFVTSMKVITIAAIICPVVSLTKADTWRGTAPWCAGECLKGEKKIGESDSGDGAYCVIGKKVLCQNSEPTCPAVQTNLSCDLVVQICDNGYYTIPDVWHSCSKFACGFCVGIGKSFLGLGSTPIKLPPINIAPIYYYLLQ